MMILPKPDRCRCCLILGVPHMMDTNCEMTGYIPSPFFNLHCRVLMRFFNFSSDRCFSLYFSPVWIKILPGGFDRWFTLYFSPVWSKSLPGGTEVLGNEILCCQFPWENLSWHFFSLSVLEIIHVYCQALSWI